VDLHGLLGASFNSLLLYHVESRQLKYISPFHFTTVNEERKPISERFCRRCVTVTNIPSFLAHDSPSAVEFSMDSQGGPVSCIAVACVSAHFVQLFTSFLMPPEDTANVTLRFCRPVSLCTKSRPNELCAGW
jgi:hypothetical protein